MGARRTSGASHHLHRQVEALRTGPLAPALEIPEPFDPRDDGHLETLAGQLLHHFREHDDVDAYVALVELTQDRLQQVASGVVRRLALVLDPDDLVASFMARLFTDVRRRQDARVRRFLSLAYTMMRFDALNQLRLARRARARGLRYGEREATWRRPADPADHASRRETEPGLARVGTLLLAVVSRCFHGLGLRDRRVLICREIEGMTYDEVAEALDLPRTQVGMILKRARERLMTRVDAAVPAALPGAQVVTPISFRAATACRRTRSTHTASFSDATPLSAEHPS